MGLRTEMVEEVEMEAEVDMVMEMWGWFRCRSRKHFVLSNEIVLLLKTYGRSKVSTHRQFRLSFG